MLKISEEAKNKATKCENNFKCLEGWQCHDCKADGTLGDRQIFVRRTQYRDCPYCFPFGYAHICCCPVRNEIYRKYNI